MKISIKSFAITAVLTMLCIRPSMALDNSIYIQQSGNNGEINMTQDGAGNVIRGIQGVGTDSTTPALIIGNANTVTVNQIGTSNTLDMGIQTSVQNGATGGNQFSYSIYGNNGTAIIDSNNDNKNSSASNSISVTQTGDFAYANVNVLGGLNVVSATTSGGSYNSVTSTVNGNYNTQTISINEGGNNSVTINQGIGGSAIPLTTSGLVGPGTASNNSSANLSISGASNIVAISQTGGANTTVVSMVGSSNNANIVQSAIAGNTTVNLNSSGNGNVFNITSINH